MVWLLYQPIKNPNRRQQQSGPNPNATNTNGHIQSGRNLQGLVEYYGQNATSCHHLSIWLNCLTGLTSGIASIAEKWLVICTFLLSGPLSHIFPHSAVLALGQRMRRCLFYMLHIIMPHIIILDGQFLIVLAHRCSGLLLATVSPSYCLMFIII